MDGASGFKKKANIKVPKTCILLFGQQGPLKMVAKRRLLPNTDMSTQFILTQTDKKNVGRLNYN